METSLFMRISVLAILITVFAISGYYRKKARQEGGQVAEWRVYLDTEENWHVLELP